MAGRVKTLERGDAIPAWLPLLLGALTAVGPVSTDVYLPAMPQMEQELHGAPGAGSLTMAAWVLGLAIGQISMGPLSDRFGRKLPVLVGMAGYTIGEIGCALSSDMTVMCVWRVFAAIMASAGLVVPNACIRDLTVGDASSRLMSRLTVIQGAVPILAPMLGGLALHYVDWRMIFWATVVFGALCTVLVAVFFPETLSPSLRGDLRPTVLLRRYRAIFRSPSFTSHTLIWGCLGVVTFTYLSAAPELFEGRFGMNPAHYGMLFGVFAVGAIGASAVNGALVGRVRGARLMIGAVICALVGASAALVISLAATHGAVAGAYPAMWLAPMIVALFFCLAPGGIVAPNAMATALSAQEGQAGSAAALVGTTQYVCGASASALFGLFAHNVGVSLALVLLGAYVVAAGLAVWGYKGQKDNMR
ncbi:multidrug effflux MFS transporter [Neokomagataea thailandica]|uniref:Bcr/CflA family efflux transporter n=1 Tax=Neokomagataea tanensis NBRC 106556 TaxID=1223519 RepID=A0ABQ0QGP8_9PROT|nr:MULTISPECIES: multidrug effflux MFS transporter [Neokomagataea]GBR43996.1 multidrug ABC transporter [Neokomagataea tanensis NBRC 106556]